MAVNIGTLAAGIGSGIKNLGTTLSTAQSQIQQAALRGAQQAQIDANLKDRLASQQAIANLAKNLGYPPDMFGGASTAEEARSRLLYNAALRAYGAAGMLSPVGQVVQAAQQLQANQPQTAPAPQDTSFSDNASVTPPISAIGQKAPAQDVAMARQQSAQNVGRNAELLKQIIQDTGAIENSLKGGSMYKSTPNGGYFNSYYAEGGVADPEARSMYQAKNNAQIQNIDNQIANRNTRTGIAAKREARVAANANKRGHGRGHSRRGSSGGSSRGGGDDVRGGGGGGSSAPQQSGEWQPNARQRQAFENYKAGKISYDQLVRTR